jgi:outer membrane receptor for ferrienterochelin and colicins
VGGIQDRPTVTGSRCDSLVVLRCLVAFLLSASSRPALALATAEDPGEGDIEQMDLASMLETPLEVWAATKTEREAHQAPAIITTVTREQIEVWGYRSVAEILSHLLGFYVVDDHTTPNLAVRGISGGLYADSSIVKVLIDGHSVAFHATGGNWLGPELVPLSAIDRIEVVRGPASALFGADAFLGVISIKTRTGRSLDGVHARLTGGRTGQEAAGDLDVSAGLQRGPFDLLLSGRYNQRDLSGLSLLSPPAAIEASDAASPRSLEQRSTSALARLTYRPGSGTELGGFGYFSGIRRDADGNRLSAFQVRAGLFWDQALSTQLDLSFRGSWFHGAPGADGRLEVGSEHFFVRREFSFRGGDLDTQLTWKPLFSLARPLEFVAGVSAFLDDELLPSRIGVAKQIENSPPGAVIEAISIRQGHRTFLNLGAYLQGIWELLPGPLGVSGGVRYDQHNVYGGQVSERIGLVSTPLPYLHAKLLYGSAFQAPSPTLLHAVPSRVGDVVGNPNLEPQYSRTLELQLAWEPTEWLTLSTNVAYTGLSDKTEFVQQEINTVARNVSRARTLSSETSAELKLGAVARGYLSFEAQRTVRRTGQRGYVEQVVGPQGGIYPSRSAHAGVVAQPRGWPVRLATQVVYVGPRRASDNNILSNRRAYDLPPYALLDVTLSTTGFRPLAHRREEVSFALMGKNLLGTVGPAPGFSGFDHPLAPRTVLLQMQLGF